jgi:hypothetical protein
MGLEMTREVVNAGGQDCDLDFRRTRIPFSALKIRNDFRLVKRSNRHITNPQIGVPIGTQYRLAVAPGVRNRAV